jgi:hypothetical protein
MAYRGRAEKRIDRLPFAMNEKSRNQPMARVMSGTFGWLA